MLKRLYELTVVVSADTEESALETVHESVKKLVEKQKGSVKDVEDWGVKPMAYELKKQDQARYIQYVIEMIPTKVAGLKAVLRHEAQFLRWLIVSLEEERKVASV